MSTSPNQDRVFSGTIVDPTLRQSFRGEPQVVLFVRRDEALKLQGELERQFPHVLSRSEKGTTITTPKAGVPFFDLPALERELSRIVMDIRSADASFDFPREGRNPDRASTRPTAWRRYRDRHPFLELWVRISELKSEIEYLVKITADKLHQDYHALTVTGRTSCSAPEVAGVPGLNIQQVPREPELRALFIAAPGSRIITTDIRTAELRALAAICKAAFGFSKLGEVFEAGKDPYAHTAAAILGLSEPEFDSLRTGDPDRFEKARESAKPLVLGIPGGLGAVGLRESAAERFGVMMSHEDAMRFRAMLITEIYPELSDRTGYLTDDTLAILAGKLGVGEDDVRRQFDPFGVHGPSLSHRVAGVVSGESRLHDDEETRIWDGLFRLARRAPGLSADDVERIGRQECGKGLFDLLRGSAATLSGRVRGGMVYTERRNYPFQAATADGCKVALWRLLFEGFDVMAFVHDEFLVQVPAEGAEASADQVERIIIDALEDVVGEGVPMACKKVIADSWAIPGK